MDDPVEFENWMLGVFSGLSPEFVIHANSVTQYHVQENLEIDVITIRGVGIADQVTRTWEPVGKDELRMFPASEEMPVGETTEWIVKRTTDCGPHEVEAIWDDGSTVGAGSWHRGAACVRAREPCPPEGVECPGGELYWCDEAPPRCESGN